MSSNFTNENRIFQRLGPYRIVQSVPQSETPQLLILDSNVLIDIERFYFGEAGFDKGGLQSLLMEFPNARISHHWPGKAPWGSVWDGVTDINYGFAMREVGWSRTKGHLPEVARRAGHAASQVLGWEAAKIAKTFENRHAPISRDKVWPRLALPELEGSDPTPLIAPSYGLLLFLCHLDSTRKKWRSRGGEFAFLQFREWASEVLGKRGAYEIAAAIDLFLAPTTERDKVRKMLKLSGSDSPDALADKAWNAAWDMSFVRLTDANTLGFQDEEMPPAQRTALVTRNLDPWMIRARSRIRVIVDGRPYVESGFARGTQLSEQVQRATTMDLLEDYWRSKRDPQDLHEQVVAAVQSLESSLGVTQRTLFA